MAPTRSGLRIILPLALVVLCGTFALGFGVGDRFDHSGGAMPTALAGPAVPREQLERAGELSNAFVAIADAATHSVVRITAEHTGTADERRVPRSLHDFFDGPDGDFPAIAGGSGFLVSPDGYVLTNNHVIEGADRITVTLLDKRNFDARVVGRDPTTDVAVLKIDAKNLPAVHFGDSDAARVGEWVLAIGNPGFGAASTLDFTVTSGIISAKGRPLNILASEMGARDPASRLAIEDFIQTDAVINPGNSGGPLVNLRGEVIGINSAIASSTGYSEGYGFAIPANLARRVMGDLIQYGHVRRALLGISISDVSAEDAEAFHLPSIAGVLVEDFPEDSPAERAGMQRGDVIVALDSTPVERLGQLQRLVAQRQPGETVDVGVIRYGKRQAFEVKLTQAELPVPDEEKAAPTSPGLGVEVVELTPAIARRFGFARAGGAVVSRLAPLGVGSRKLEHGDRIVSIDRQPVTSAKQARETLAAVRSGQVVTIMVERRDGSTHIANLRAP